jgi:glutamyl/glutaminyl-tRNA synthetase
MKTLQITFFLFLCCNFLNAQERFKNLPLLNEQEFTLFLDEMLVIGCINNKMHKKLLSQRDSLPQRDEIENSPLSSDRIFAFLAIQREADTKEKVITLKKWITAFEKKYLLRPKEVKRMNIFLDSQKVAEINLRTFWLAMANWDE